MGFQFHTDGNANLEYDSTFEIMVKSENELAQLKTMYPAAIRPGVIAYTAGFKNMWQLNADGNWIDMMS